MDGSFDEHYAGRREACLAFAEIDRVKHGRLVKRHPTTMLVQHEKISVCKRVQATIPVLF